MKIVSSVFLLLFSIASIASAEVIDVNIKGMYDGIKTNRQQDYQEAVMNAKLQAIERAGASIESITKVVNFQLKYDAVESKSKAILLPGFQIIDIGYVADGSYQVVLIGKIKTIDQVMPGGGQQPSATDREQRPIITGPGETGRDGRFIAYDNGTVMDTRTNLMWAAKDNGADIMWTDAKVYCQNYRGGGYTDWRMPIEVELKGLYDNAKAYKLDAGRLFGKASVHLTELIRLSSTHVWINQARPSNVTKGLDALSLSFEEGEWSWTHEYYGRISRRALPVRSGK
jgi:hypothetical protein